mmetsp:Transcript_28689/g.60857  ORF Transcript_28689/g.60857 Transcript_28689/m.60857 type:complete len:285 (-) Transcript_28689:164-1018(-)
MIQPHKGDVLATTDFRPANLSIMIQPHKAQPSQTSIATLPTRPTPYLIITNISKRRNIQSLLQIAISFGCPIIFVVGQKAFDFDPHGADIPTVIKDVIRCGRVKIIRFDSLEECVWHIKSLPCAVVVGGEDCSEFDVENDTSAIAAAAAAPTTPGTSSEMISNATPPPPQPKSNCSSITKHKQTIQIIGVEIDNTSQNLENEPFTTSVAFMMGNEGSGMTAKQMSFCDGFVRISQYGGGTASLNVSVAASLVLHRFFHWGVRGDLVRSYCCDDDIDGGDGGGAR